MAAPSATARQTPGGIRLPNGFSSKITLKRFPAISLYEVSGTPPGFDGGEAVDITTMHNTTVRTMYPRDLYTRTDSTWTCGYDAAISSTIKEVININDEITVTWRDGTTEAFWGFVRQWTPNELADGTMPTGSLVITPTNIDNTIVERESVVSSVTGT